MYLYILSLCFVRSCTGGNCALMNYYPKRQSIITTTFDVLIDDAPCCAQSIRGKITILNIQYQKVLLGFRFFEVVLLFIFIYIYVCMVLFGCVFAINASKSYTQIYFVIQITVLLIGLWRSVFG